MSVRKVNGLSFHRSLSLSATDIRVCKSGIEFHTAAPVSLWTEMVLDLQSPHEPRKIHCTGVVVCCHGDFHEGYTVSMLFTHISRHSQEALAELCSSRLN